MLGDEKRLRDGRSLKRQVLLGCALLCAALAVAQTPDPQRDKAPQDAPHIFAGPAEAVAHDSSLITEPPGTQSEIPHISDATWSLWDDLWSDTWLRDVKLTDLLIALFAAVVALFAARFGSVTSGLRAASRRQAEETHRLTGASEKASESARRSAEAAEKLVAGMRDTTERQLRAYVTVRQFMQTPVKDERQGQGWLFQVAWQNTGATPTKAFRYWAMLREFERAIPEDFPFTPSGLKDFAGGELGSNSSVNTPPLFVSPQLIARLKDGSCKVLLLGQADYGDVLTADAKRETRFCVEVVLVGDPGGTNPPFTFAYHPTHNHIT